MFRQSRLRAPPSLQPLSGPRPRRRQGREALASLPLDGGGTEGEGGSQMLTALNVVEKTISYNQNPSKDVPLQPKRKAGVRLVAAAVHSDNSAAGLIQPRRLRIR